jgi:hypothetical protein
MKTLIFIVLVALAASEHVRREHNYWYTAGLATAKTGVPYTDVAWNYCDIKCATFEKQKPGYDFFIINFQDAVYKPNFSACYATAPGSSTPTLWNKVVQNKWYEDNCGKDDTDYLTNTAYKVVDKVGVGIGTAIVY